eukprot:TRINITY_DN40657_c0_g1_i1.p1 TRINITY_DN40657_c0_g1~~TRINITY_DN40657_c0_g1_i1.p1  ORF type:complete len:562 (+),score=98.76 TRINITY_DN40657_c0_g1_i1:78-1763(+)
MSEALTESVLRIFQAFDLNGDGILSRSEFSQILKYLEPKVWTEERIDSIFFADSNADGLIDFNEFVKWCFDPGTAQGDLFRNAAKVTRGDGANRFQLVIEQEGKGKLCSVSVTGPTFIRSVKADIEKATEIPVLVQKLMYKGAECYDSEMLVSSPMPLTDPTLTLVRRSVTPFQVFVFGGVSCKKGKWKTHASKEMLDVTTGDWATMSKPPVARVHAQSGTVSSNGKVYMLGGQDIDGMEDEVDPETPPSLWHSGGDILACGDIYDPADGNWSHMKPMTVSRCRFAIASDGKRIFVAGGITDDVDGAGIAVLQKAEVYDIEQHRWSELPEMSVGRHSCTGVVADGMFYVIGGDRSLQSDVPCSFVDAYNIEKEQWESVNPMSQPRRGCTALAMPGMVFAIGGEQSEDNQFVSEIEVLDLAAGTWTSLAPLNCPRICYSAVVFGGKLFAIGGRVEKKDLATVEAYDPASKSWTEQASLSTPRHDASAVLTSAKILILGGKKKSKSLTSTEIFDPQTGWTEGAPIPGKPGESLITLATEANTGKWFVEASERTKEKALKKKRK